MIETPSQILEHYASADAAKGFIDWRKATKKPLTERAAVRVANTLRDITASGGDADEALDLAAEHGWQTIKAEWYWRIKRADGSQLKLINGGQHGQVTSGFNQKNLNTHATTRAISFAGKARRTPSSDCF